MRSPDGLEHQPKPHDDQHRHQLERHDHHRSDHDHSHAGTSPPSITITTMPRYRVEHNPAALISARNLMLARGGRTILADIDIDISPREIVTVIGPNGAGKTTLVRACWDWSRWTAAASAASRGWSPAMPRSGSTWTALSRSPWRASCRWAGSASPDELARVLKDVGAGRLAERQLSELSGGELQRVVLARALIRSPDLLVLDEPVRGVDYAGEAELYTLIGRLRTERGFGVLLVSHDLHVVMAQSDRVICLNRHVCCSGVPQSVAQHPEYARLFGPQAARAFGLYHHHHDHSHDLAGEPRPPRPAWAEDRR